MNNFSSFKIITLINEKQYQSNKINKLNFSKIIAVMNSKNDISATAHNHNKRKTTQITEYALDNISNSSANVRNSLMLNQLKPVSNSTQFNNSLDNSNNAYSLTSQTPSNTSNTSNTALISKLGKGLNINTNDETNKYSFANLGVSSATNNSSASIYGLTKNSLILGGQTTKSSNKSFDIRKSTPMTSTHLTQQTTPKNTFLNNQNISIPVSSFNQTTQDVLTIKSSPSNAPNKSTTLSSSMNLHNEANKFTNKSQTLELTKCPLNDKNSTAPYPFNETIANHKNPNQTNIPIVIKKISIPNHEPTKCSVKRNGIVKAYAANTNQGIVRNYNEDRVSIILNIMKPAFRVNETWPKCSFFGIYDGHGGVMCADFLRDNLHQFVFQFTEILQII